MTAMTPVCDAQYVAQCVWDLYNAGVEYNKAIDQAATDFMIPHRMVREMAGEEE